ncbi:hypothetical protein ABT261_19755, partial [Amycolatopsis sp. NPDC000740]
MVSIEMRLSGVDELQAALAAAVERMDTVTREATAAAASLVEIAVKDKLRQSSHRRGTPTPSSPGQPPALAKRPGAPALARTSCICPLRTL